MNFEQGLKSVQFKMEVEKMGVQSLEVLCERNREKWEEKNHQRIDSSNHSIQESNKIKKLSRRASKEISFKDSQKRNRKQSLILFQSSLTQIIELE